jgi:hypothetical protein|tara:strand:+ start:91 stop:465 length:375 start_codon:yes stop_codon:yes gene_type:complete
MIFPQYKYKEYNNTNKKYWPLQPATIENWCKMVNEAHEYCVELKDVFEFDEIIYESSPPSFHPYWKLQSFKRTIELIEETRKTIEETRHYIINGGFHRTNAQQTIYRNKESIKFYLSKLYINKK